MKSYGIIFFLVILCTAGFAQPSFVQYQRSFPHVAAAMQQREDTLRKQFEKAGFQWPPKDIYIRAFKYDSQLEIWARNTDDEAFKLFKTYRVCALAGTLGPKRIEGDYQVPEGFYYINKFIPNSEFNLALSLNYPNASDKILSDSLKPGGGIYIHGSCVTVGCIPLMDNIQEVYLLAAQAKQNGEDFIPVHIFPVKYSNAKSVDYLARQVQNDSELQAFESNLKKVFDYFDKEKKLPVISTNKKGEYIFL